MKQSKKQQSDPYITLEYLNTLVNDVMRQWVEPELLKKNYFGSSETPCISFEIAQDAEKTIRVRMMVRHDPFGTSVHKTECKYYSLTHIDGSAIVNQLFNTLTFDRSPYYWYKTHFKKKLEVM